MSRELVPTSSAVKYAPSSGKFKIYIIDEVHMLSKNAFNALLKTLEEPPPHVVFIFATTDWPIVLLGIGTLVLGAIIFFVWSWHTQRWPFALPVETSTVTPNFF